MGGGKAHLYVPNTHNYLPLCGSLDMCYNPDILGSCLTLFLLTRFTSPVPCEGRVLID